MRSNHRAGRFASVPLGSARHGSSRLRSPCARRNVNIFHFLPDSRFPRPKLLVTRLTAGSVRTYVNTRWGERERNAALPVAPRLLRAAVHARVHARGRAISRCACRSFRDSSLDERRATSDANLARLPSFRENDHPIRSKSTEKRVSQDKPRVESSRNVAFRIFRKSTVHGASFLDRSNAGNVPRTGTKIFGRRSSTCENFSP